jgi:short-subunit dehydrogenase
LKSLAEHLAHDLRTPSSSIHSPSISVHLLIPGWTYTSLSGNSGPTPDDEALKSKPKGAWLPSQVAEYAFEKIVEEKKFYILCPDEDVSEELDQARMRWGAEDVVDGRPPLSRWDEGWKDRARSWIEEEKERRRRKE